MADGLAALETPLLHQYLLKRKGKMALTSIDIIKAESELKGKLKGSQNNIMTILAVRLGPVPNPVKEKVLRCLDFNLLETMLVKSLEAKTMEEFNSHLG
ncbi:MAG: hypothetical protein LBU79_07125 [Planctomycetota bacterium]|nr:hypothetical protein [Planctomycetota bacterium]